MRDAVDCDDPVERRRTSTVGQPHAPALHRRLARDAPQPLELASRLVVVPPHHTARAVHEQPIDRCPISVSFWTIHSGRSPFGIAQPTVSTSCGGSARRISLDDRHDHAVGSSLAVAHRPAPSLTVIDVGGADAQHPAQVVVVVVDELRVRRATRRTRAPRIRAGAGSREGGFDPREQSLLGAADGLATHSANFVAAARSRTSVSLVGHLARRRARAGRRAHGRAGECTPRWRRTNSLPGCVPAGTDDLLVAVERRQHELGAERRLGDRDRQLGDQVVAVAGEPSRARRHGCARTGRRPHRHAGPTAPRPVSRSVEPVSTPAGTSTW